MKVARFGVSTAVKNHVEVFWVVTSFNVVLGYQRFGGLCCPHLHPEGPPKRWYPNATEDGFTNQETLT